MRVNTAVTSSDIAGPELERLQAQLTRHIEGFGGPVRAERLAGGQSNPTYVLHTPGGRYIMRCKPAAAAKLLPSAHAIEREFRVQSVLAQAGFPVARMHHLCTDESLIGRAFYVMEHVDGRILFDQSLPGCSRAERAAMYDEMNRVIAALHRIDFAQLGLSDFGKPGNYIARQIDRWTRQYRASQTGHIEAMEHLIGWLPACIPAEAQPPVSIVHGDFRLDNLIFHPREPRILAVIDWELSTLGHPLADFAYHTMSWHIRGNAFRGVADLDLAGLGIPDEETYWNAYLRRTGFTLRGDRRYYLAYNLFRIAGILQGIARRALDGIAASAQAEEVGARARAMAELGWEIARQMGARPIGPSKEA